MAETPTPSTGSVATDLLLPFALLRIKALENVVAGQQARLDGLMPLQRDVLELHSALTGRREADAREFAALREAQGELEERFSSELAALGDHLATLERSVEENDGKLNAVQTTLLQGRMEAVVALDDRLRVRQREPKECIKDPQANNLEHCLDVADLQSCCDMLLAHQRRADLQQAQLESLQGRLFKETAALSEQLHALEARVEGRPQGPCSPPSQREWTLAAGEVHARASLQAVCGTQDLQKDDFDDDVGEGERPLPRPCGTIRPSRGA